MFLFIFFFFFVALEVEPRALYMLGKCWVFCMITNLLGVEVSESRGSGMLAFRTSQVVSFPFRYSEKMHFWCWGFPHLHHALFFPIHFIVEQTSELTWKTQQQINQTPNLNTTTSPEVKHLQLRLVGLMEDCDSA